MLIALLLAQAQEPLRDALEELALDGRVASAPAGLEQARDYPLAAALARLAPPWTSGRRVPEEERRAAAAFVLDAWLRGEPAAQTGVVPARLRAQLDADAVRRLAAALRQPTEGGPSADQIAALLKSASPGIAAPALLAAALDPDVHPGVRGDLAETLVLLQGRPGLRALLPALTPDADERLLRQVFAAWRQIAAPEDIPLLERIAREGYGSPTQYALQLWGRMERDPRRRMQIFELAIESPSGYAHLALDALAEGGTDAAIAGRLRDLLRVGSSSQRGIALRALPHFDSQEAVLAAFRGLGTPLSVSAAAWWMPVLAQSPLSEARAEAARWLATGGFGAGSVALTVVRALSDSPEVLPLIGGLLARPDVPSTISLPLAIAQAADSPDAIAYLRGVARSGSGLEQMQALQRLGGLAAAEDIDWFETMCFGSEFAPSARAVAFTQLMRNRAGERVIAAWLAQPPQDWELAEALVRDVLEYGDPAQRAAALAFARGGGGFAAEDERLALRATAWHALGQRGEPAGLEELAADFRELLEADADQGRPAEQDWRDLYERLHAWPGLESISAAARLLAPATAEAPLSAALAQWDPLSTSPELLWAAAALWSGVDAPQALLWLDALDAMDLSEANRVRVRALRAARARAPLPERQALRALLEEPRLLRAYPLLLAQAFAPEGAGWTLFHDRLAEREILADARCQPDAAAADRLAELLDGWCEPDVLLSAGRLAAELQGGATLALRLARRGGELHPLHPDLGILLAELLEKGGDVAAAREAWAAVERMVPPGFPQHETAAARRRALETDGDARR